jgi:crotonobetainyl-CoA:carnitine CoA-transferase CaiB-like acyl-CoA transferase
MDYAMNGTQPARIGNRDPLMAPHNCYPCAGEDDWITIACGTEDEWRSLCQLMGRFDLIADPRFATARDRKANEEELDSLIGGWTSDADRWELTRHLQAAGVAAFPSMSSKDLVEDKHLSARHFFVRLPHPEVGARVHAGIPWKLTHSPNGVQASAPLLGQHTEEIARDVLGYSEERIESLRQQELFH